MPGPSGLPASAEGSPGAGQAGGHKARGIRLLDRLLSIFFPGPGSPVPEDVLRRTDVRLVPSAALVWSTAAVGHYLQPGSLAVLCLLLMAAAVLLLLRAPASVGAAVSDKRRRRSFKATLAVALLLAAAAGAHAAVESYPRHQGAVAAAAAAQAAVAVEVDVTGTPRRLKKPGSSGLADRWAVPAMLVEMNADARRVRTHARVLVLGGAQWEHATPGQRVRTTGKLTAPAPGQAEAAVLSTSSGPSTLGGPGPWQRGPGEFRKGFATAAGQFNGDARGLLPGMVTGDTSFLDAELDAAMKSVGMTHLTAVSGANCSLVLGALLLAARSLRCSRAVAAVFGVVGLGLFVLMVGPDASVLRAAVMGAIGLVALSGGRPGRGLSFLCLAVIGLLLAQPELSTSIGFLLSVLATLGIVVTGRPVMGWFPPAVPRWAAAGVAVPLSAQTFCGPVVVLLQPQFSSYALPANMAAALLVAPVTLLGTAAVPLVPLSAVLAAAPLGIAAAFATGVGGVARFFAGLPGAVLPWPEGAFGAATMALFSAGGLAAWWLVFHPARTVGLALAAHGRTVALLSRMPAFADGLRVRRGRRGSGLVQGSGRGRLRLCKQSSGRKPQWLLPRPHAPGPRHQRPPPGAM
ncbi:MAG TPA: ComEC/Rec2 family competence protein [Arthrobacter sp.]|nr:ComEC/Rec2 family competence protein [Arthrobacter sp.]